MKTKHLLPGAVLLLLCILTTNLLSAQNTIRVPTDQPTIQAAVNVAQEGDTVLVSPGLYHENVQLRGRNIVLTSRYFLENDPAATIRQTIVDGSQPVHPDTASCLLIWKGETAATVIQGFTFRGGKGTVWLDPAGAGTFREGGGILTEFSAPVIRHNIIRDNTVTPGGAGIVSTGGGGIRSGEGAVRIENNYIVHNSAEGYGGGIVLNFCPDAVVQNNIIAFNFGGKNFGGGGFWATGAGGTTNLLKNNTIAYNESPGPVGQYGGKGGGVWIFAITLHVENNIVWGNKQVSGKPLARSGGAFEMLYNCVETGFAGTGTIQTNPAFRDTSTFILEAGSPAIDAGNPDGSPGDFTRNNRTAAFPARGKLLRDLGAYSGLTPQNPASGPSFKAPFLFSKVLNSPVVTTKGDSRSVNWIDIDGDEDQDLFISNGPEQGENNFMYLNNGTGGFTALTNDPVVLDGKPSDGATWADFDNDGDVDGFVVNWYGFNNLCYKNNGNGTFTQVTAGAFVTDGGHSETATWGDYDNDGNLDLYVTNSAGNKRNFLYHNEGNGTFSKVGTGALVTDAFASRSANWTDIDLDGDLDLFVTNEKNALNIIEDENLYRNNGNETFTKVTTGPLVNDGGITMSSSWGDYDNDGDLDVFLANDLGNDALFQNDGSGNFTKMATPPVTSSGGNSFGSQWEDVDNDGDLDLFVTNSFWGGLWKNFLFINQGNGTFVRNLVEVPAVDEGWSYGCAFGDFDRDGDVDLAVANCYNADQEDYLYESHAAELPNNWLVVHCVGTTSNHSAIGAKVRVTANIGGQTVTQLREISAQSGYCGENQLPAHFGLGDATGFSMTVEWPSGLEEAYGNLFPNQYITLTEGLGVSGVETPQTSVLRIFPPAPNPFNDSVLITWEQFSNTPVLIEIADLQGKLIVSRQITGIEGKQQFEWNGRDAQGVKVADGQYVVVVKTAGFTGAKQVVKFGK